MHLREQQGRQAEERAGFHLPGLLGWHREWDGNLLPGTGLHLHFTSLSLPTKCGNRPWSQFCQKHSHTFPNLPAEEPLTPYEKVKGTLGEEEDEEIRESAIKRPRVPAVTTEGVMGVGRDRKWGWGGDSWRWTTWGLGR